MPKNTCQKDTETALKKAIQQDKWILLIGGTCEERKWLSEVAYKSKEIVNCNSAFCMYFYNLSRATEQQLYDYDYDRIFPNKNKFVLLDVAGCSSEEMSRKILGPEYEEESKSPNDRLRNKPILNILVQERLLFIDNFCCKHVNAVKKISAQLRMYKSEYPGFRLGQLIIGVESKKYYETLPDMFTELFTPLYLESGSTYELKKHEEKAVCKGKEIFDDVKLKMSVDLKGNYKYSHFEVSVNCKTPLGEFKLESRFMPVLYLLVKGVEDDSLFVTNSALKKAYGDPDDAKSKITKSFKNVIGSRAKKIINVIWGDGKKLMIPKKNISLKVNSS